MTFVLPLTDSWIFLPREKEPAVKTFSCFSANSHQQRFESAFRWFLNRADFSVVTYRPDFRLDPQERANSGKT